MSSSRSDHQIDRPPSRQPWAAPRGFTLIELLISLVLLSVVTGAIFMLLTTSQRVTRAQGERTELQSNVRTGAIVVPAELRQINAVVGGTVVQNDIVSMAAGAITYRSMRGIGFLCQPATTGEVRILASTWSGYRDPVAVRDGAYVFVDNDPDLSSDDVWLPITIIAVNKGNVCPGGALGYTLTVSPLVRGLISAPDGGPVRTYEVMELKLYDQDGRSWLGARSVSTPGEVTQPVLGPLVPGNGLVLEYLNSAGGTAASVDQVKSIRVTLRGLSDQAITTGTGSAPEVVGDSLVTQVVLRNALR